MNRARHARAEEPATTCRWSAVRTVTPGLPRSIGSAGLSLHQPQVRSAAVAAIRSAKSQNRRSTGVSCAIHAALVLRIYRNQHDTHDARLVVGEKVVDVPVQALSAMHVT